MTDRKRSNRRLWAMAVGAVVVIGLAIGFLIVPKWREARRQRLVELKNVALGELENEALDKAFVSLEQISDWLPDDPFGPRNLAVARLVDLDRQDPRDHNRFVERLTRAREATTKLASMKDQAATARWIEARIQRLDDDKNGRSDKIETLALLEQAASMMPENPAIWYELYFTITGTADIRSDADALRRAHRALGEAYKLAPDNYTVLRYWLEVQALSKDQSIVDTLGKAKATFAPLREIVLMFYHHDVLAMIDEAMDSARSGDWKRTGTLVSTVGNLVKPDESQLSDVRRVDAHALSMILTDFSPDLYRDWKPQEAAPQQPAISFEPQPVEIDSSAGDRPTDVRLTDFDLDGAMDVVAISAGRVAVLGRQSNAGRWREKMSCDLPSGLTRIHAVDLFRTKEPDAPRLPAAKANPKTDAPGCQYGPQGIVAFGAAGLRILQYDTAKPSPAEALAIIDQSDDLNGLRDVTQVGPIDFDSDGDLDLAILAGGRVSLWMNRSDSTFIPARDWSQMPPDSLSFSGLAVVDFDRDVDLDVMLTGPAPSSLGYLENLRHGVFRWRNLDDANYDPLRGSWSIASAELDGNASWDLVGAGNQGLGTALTMTPATGVITPKGSSLIKGDFEAPSLILCDYDNDAAIDALMLSAGKVTMFRGSASAASLPFAADEQMLARAPANVTACDVGDVDGDGDLDIAVATPEGLSLLENRGAPGNHWIDVRARGKSDTVLGRANHYGIGSLIELRTKTRYQAQTIDRQTTHFGLGQESPADAMRIVWTTGIPQARVQPKQDQLFCEPMVLKGSCPYLFTWTGERFEFFTDLLWAAPLGLQLAEGQLAPCRPWEYLKIPGDRLAITDGAYQLQITSELWEADYFDKVELIAIDHPADVDIYSNEKVGPAEIAEYRIHTVKNRRTPLGARDKVGRDVLPLVLVADGQFMKGFDRTFRQGLTEEHYLELDFGSYDHSAPVTLFLTGWIRPTDTSINVSLSQDPTLEAPRPPYLLAPDANGKWTEIRPYMGFPGGKTKTIAIELTGAFPTNDHRLRIATSNEIYWDEAFYTVGEPPAETLATRLRLLSADLHYRGFSRARPAISNHPETYYYDKPQTAAKWPPMGGQFTRYGDVQTLLTDVDSRLVVMAAGDEATLRFAAPADPPPEGWKRDFFLNSFGWDKDADLNTVYGQNVEPLPFAEMHSYPYAEGESYPDTPELRAYLKEFQTRETDPNLYWKQVLRGR